jgi:glutathione synthase/RimK-type ligase-like ATP-grasp enzyme
VLNATDKARQRQRWAAAGIAQPAFRIVPAPVTQDTIRQAPAAVGFPCLVKAVSLSASQGVLRADHPAAAVTAASRIRHILAAAARPDTEPLLVEEYLPGPELSIDALLTTGGGLVPGRKRSGLDGSPGDVSQPAHTADRHRVLSWLNGSRRWRRQARGVRCSASRGMS